MTEMDIDSEVVVAITESTADLRWAGTLSLLKGRKIFLHITKNA